MHGAVHRLQVVVEPLLGHLPFLILLLVQMHGRVHAVLVPLQVPGNLVEMPLGDMRGLNEGVPVAAVHLAGVVLHGVDDCGTLGMEDRQAGTDFVREGEQVHFGAQLAVVALGGLLQPGQVCLQVLLGGPGGAVDALKHGILFVASPVGRGRTHQFEALNVASIGQVGPAAKVLPHRVPVTIEVVVHGQLTTSGYLCGFLTADFGLLGPYQLQFVGLTLFFGTGLFLTHHPPLEALGGFDDPLHPLLDLLEIVGSEGLLNIEVVVEPVLDHRADSQFGIRPDFLDSLGHDMGRGVPHDGQSVLAGQLDGLN